MQRAPQLAHSLTVTGFPDTPRGPSSQCGPRMQRGEHLLTPSLGRGSVKASTARVRRRGDDSPLDQSARNRVERGAYWLEHIVLRENAELHADHLANVVEARVIVRHG